MFINKYSNLKFPYVDNAITQKSKCPKPVCRPQNDTARQHLTSPQRCVYANYDKGIPRLTSPN